MKDFWSEQYRLLLNFYRDRFSTVLRDCGIVFAAIFVFALIYGTVFPEQAETTVGFFVNSSALGGLDLGDPSAFLLSIFINNVNASGNAILFGLLPLVYLAALPLGYNAFLLGMFAAYYTLSDVSLLTFAAGILPHGIFELPALVCACAAGIFVCREMTKRVLKKEISMAFSELVRNALRVFTLLVVPLMAIAAVVETYVTPKLMLLFLS